MSLPVSVSSASLALLCLFPVVLASVSCSGYTPNLLPCFSVFFCFPFCLPALCSICIPRLLVFGFSYLLPNLLGQLDYVQYLCLFGLPTCVWTLLIITTANLIISAKPVCLLSTPACLITSSMSLLLFPLSATFTTAISLIYDCSFLCSIWLCKLSW